jgi:polysaccharide biosynthesis protein PelG
LPNAAIDLVVATIAYSFIFSLINSGGFVLLISRYISDCIYTKEYSRILPSFYGIQTVIIIVSGLIGMVFYSISPLPFTYKFLAYILFILLNMLWVEMSYISAVRNYIEIVKAFLGGGLIIIITSVTLTEIIKTEEEQIFIFSITLGFFFIVANLGVYIKSYFKYLEGDIFDFLTYMKKYRTIFFTGLLLTLAAYAHNFIFWFSGYRTIIGGTYVTCPLYDVAVFFSMVITIPATVLFIVSVETNFYEKYKQYYSSVLNGGTIHEIKIARKEMISVLFQEITYVMEIQLFVSIVSVVLGIKYLVKLNFTEFATNLFSILAIASFGYICFFIVLLIFLYFDERKEVFIASVIFLLSSIVFSLISLGLGENYYGFGYFIAAFVSLGYSLLRLFKFLENIDYRTFCYQPLVPINERVISIKK